MKFNINIETTLKMKIDSFFGNFISLYGIPTSIMSNRDIRFTTQFRQHIIKRLEFKIIMTTPWHPQKNDQIKNYK